MTPRFVIIMPAYNAAPWIEASLRSALEQVYDQFCLIVTDDASTDGTAQIVDPIRAEGITQGTYAIGLLRQATRRGALAAFQAMIDECQDDDVLVFLDADDLLAHPGVLRRLAGLYLDPEVWATYGSFRYDDASGGGMGMAAPMPPDQHNRRAGWRCTHLKTCYAGLAKLVVRQDLVDPATGKYFDASGDMALFYPVIEMAGPQHARFVSEVLYIYNMQNRGSETYRKPEEQARIAALIEAREPYALLPRLPWRTP